MGRLSIEHEDALHGAEDLDLVLEEVALQQELKYYEQVAADLVLAVVF